MTTIAILPENPDSPTSGYRAVAGDKQSVGKTAGQALDALTAQLNEAESGTLVVVQNLRPDGFFTAAQQQRLEDLMTRWRAARDSNAPFPAADQAELEALVAAELAAAVERTKALTQGLAP